MAEAQEIFQQVYVLDRKADDPEQFRDIGWIGPSLYSVIFEVRHDVEGEYSHLITAWKSTRQEEQVYANNI